MKRLYTFVKIWLQLSLGVVLVLAFFLIKAKNGWDHPFFHEKFNIKPLIQHSVSMKTVQVPTEIQLSLEGYYEIIPTMPFNQSDNKPLKWESSDTSVALVDDQGVVFAQGKAGQCEVTVTVMDGSGISQTTRVIVSNTNDRDMNFDEVNN